MECPCFRWPRLQWMPVIPLQAIDEKRSMSQLIVRDEFFTYLKDSFDVLHAEGETSPKMMTVGLHCRVVGRPGRAADAVSRLRRQT